MAISQKPFTAIVEDTMIEVRENSSETAVENKYKRRVNDVYVRMIPGKYEFEFLRSLATISISAAYSTGTVSGTAGTSAITGTSTVWTAAMSAWKMKISGVDEIYTYVYGSAVTGTLYAISSSGALALATLPIDVTAATYILFQDTYNTALDYDRLVLPPGFYYDYGGSKVQLSPLFIKDWYKTWTTSSSALPTSYRFFGRDTTNLYWQVQFTPPITTARKVNYEYFPQLIELTEYTTGTCATAAGDATVTGTSTDFTNNVSTGDAFRIDSAPNDWYIVSVVSDATHLELTSAYPATKTTTTYTISEVPRFPTPLNLALFYGACALSAQDQDNATAAKNYYALMEENIKNYFKIENRYKYGRQKMGVKDLYRGR